MCFFSTPKAPAPAPVPPRPARSTSSGFAQDARITALRAQGTSATIATSPLCDTGFGSAVKKPTFLGATAGYAT